MRSLLVAFRALMIRVRSPRWQCATNTTRPPDAVPDRDLPRLFRRMFWIAKRHRERVEKYRRGLFKGYTVFLDIGSRLGRVPLVNHRPVQLRVQLADVAVGQGNGFSILMPATRWPRFKSSEAIRLRPIQSRGWPRRLRDGNRGMTTDYCLYFGVTCPALLVIIRSSHANHPRRPGAPEHR
jgi:hypothetical protein